MVERVDLYSKVPPPGENIPVFVYALLVEELLLMEHEIKWAVKRLRNYRSGAPSGMRAKHNKGWLAKERKTRNRRRQNHKKQRWKGQHKYSEGQGGGGGGRRKKGGIHLQKCPTVREW